jgi:hypothetical protein
MAQVDGGSGDLTMVPTLFGRLQTRLVLLALVGGVLTAGLAPVLPVAAPLGDRYRAAYVVLAAVAALGLGWELVYQFLMQWRWEKDWPTLFGLLTLAPEGAVVWSLNQAGALPGLPTPVPPAAFALDLVVVWLAVWLTANGPLRVPCLRWRFHGGRFL